MSAEWRETLPVLTSVGLEYIDMLRYSLLNITLWLFAVMAYGKGSELKVLQMNIWQEGTMVKGGFEAIADEVARLEPDIVLFSEVRNYHGKQFISRILQALEERGKKYYGENSKLDVGILSKYKIEEQAPNCPLEDDAGSVLKARIRINGRDVVVYSAHLDYTHYACYLPSRIWTFAVRVICWEPNRVDLSPIWVMKLIRRYCRKLCMN